MLRAVSATSEALTRLVKTIVGLLIGAIVVITLVAVWWRYVVNDPISWTEQICRIFFVWVTFLGAAVLYRQKSHIAIDMLVLMMPDHLRRVVGWIVELGVLLFIVVFFIYGLKLSLDTLGHTFGALDITPASFYFAAPVSAALMFLFFIERMLDPSKRNQAGESATIL